MHHCKDPAQCKLFVQAFFKTLQKEWLGLDRHRLDKFLLLIECFVKELFVYCKQAKWSSAALNMLNDILGDLVFSNQPDGIRLHVADISLDQLVEVAPRISSQQFMQVARPFYRVLGGLGDKEVFRRVCLEFFHPISGIMKDNLKTINDQVEEESGNQDVSLQTMRNRASELRKKGVSPLMGIEPSEIATTVFEVAAGSETPQGRRKTLYSMHSTFEKLAQKYQNTFSNESLSSKDSNLTGGKENGESELSTVVKSKKGKNKKKNKDKQKVDSTLNNTISQEQQTQKENPSEEMHTNGEEKRNEAKKDQKAKKNDKPPADSGQSTEVKEGLNFATPKSTKKNKKANKNSDNKPASDGQSVGMEETSNFKTPQNTKKNKKRPKTDLSSAAMASIFNAEKEIVGAESNGVTDQGMSTPAQATKKRKAKSTGNKRERETSETAEGQSPTKRQVRLALNKNSEMEYSDSLKSLKKRIPKYANRDEQVTKGVLKNAGEASPARPSTTLPVGSGKKSGKKKLKK